MNGVWKCASRCTGLEAHLPCGVRTPTTQSLSFTEHSWPRHAKFDSLQTCECSQKHQHFLCWNSLDTLEHSVHLQTPPNRYRSSRLCPRVRDFSFVIVEVYSLLLFCNCYIPYPSREHWRSETNLLCCYAIISISRELESMRLRAILRIIHLSLETRLKKSYEAVWQL